MNINQTLAAEFKLRQEQIDNTVSLIDDGKTIPFIARYRKELTGSLDDQLLREIFDRLTYLRNLEKRKQEISDAITAQDKMTDEIVAAISKAATLVEVEDIYRPYKQKKRTRGKAEVFTPLWVVKKMADHAEQVLNKGDWERFVHERCLEITCGEAPFLTSRYDPTTGEPVAIPDRVGILDRKLRAIQENATHQFQWKALVSIAYQSVYGYEYQGDNLLLARVNLFLTFTENWTEKIGLPISASWAIAVATRISWNIWQMDGLKDTVPGTDTLCLIYDWEKNEEVTFRQIKEESDNV